MPTCPAMDSLLGWAVLAQLHVARDVWGPCAPTSCCGCVLVHTQLGGAELQVWPVPQDKSSPSGRGGEGIQDCPWGLRFSSHGSCCLFSEAAMCLNLPFPSPLLNIPRTRQSCGPGSMLAKAGLSQWEGIPTWPAPGLKQPSEVLPENGLVDLPRVLHPAGEDSVKVTVKFIGKG
jgi:hypothetical protein